MKKFLIILFSGIFVIWWIWWAENYTSEQKTAYNYAYSQWITTVSPIDKANISGSLTRIAMAKMISNFAINVLWIIPDSSLDCSFADVSDEMDAWYAYWVKKACQLWLMWMGSDWKKSDFFNPKWVVNRWQWATAFSRALSKYNWDIVQEISPYYSSHLQYLYSKWIINNAENPTRKSVEKRWNVMIMMYRVSKNVKKTYEDFELVGGFNENSLVEDNLEVVDSLNGNDENNVESRLKKVDNNSKHVIYHRVDNSYDQFFMDDFNAVEDVYKNIESGDRVIFLVRHSERITNCTSEWWLTAHWVELAEWVWKKLRWDPFLDTSTDFYWSSTVKRTVQTSYYVGKSRGSKVLKRKLDDDARNEYDYVNHSSDIDSVVYGNYFSDGNSYSSIEHLYEENRNTINERALASIEKLCTITEWHPFSWITSHDWFTLPITEWSTSESLTFSQSKSQWPNFMQWVAIIVHKDWWWEIYPVRSLESWKMNTWENPGC